MTVDIQLGGGPLSNPVVERLLMQDTVVWPKAIIPQFNTVLQSTMDRGPMEISGQHTWGNPTVNKDCIGVLNLFSGDSSASVVALVPIHPLL
jgi:hypothetical protein